MTAAKPPYTPVVRSGDLLFVSGQVGLADGQLVEGFEAQTKQSLANLKARLEENGADITDIVKTTVFLASIDDYAEMNEIYREFFGDKLPARSAVAVSALPFGAVFEIEAIANVR